MKTLTALLVVLFTVGFAGCTSGTTPAPDPFFGKVTISPPNTSSGTSVYSTPSYASSAPSYASQATLAAPVNPYATDENQAWPSPTQSNVAQNSFATSSVGSSGSLASSAQPTRPIYVSQAAIEESVQQPYLPGSTRSYAGSPQATTATAAPISSQNATNRALTVYPSPELQAVNGQPVREQSDIAYHSADGSIPRYGDPRSSFGRTPRARFQSASNDSSAPAWPSSDAGQNSSNFQQAVPSQSGTGRSSVAGLNVSPGNLVSSEDAENLLPPIRGYESSRTARAQGSNSQMLASSGSTLRRPSSMPTFAPTQPGSPQMSPIPSQAVNIADLPDVSRIATRPSPSNPNAVRRMNYEVPATENTPSPESPVYEPSQPIQFDAQVRPISYTSPVLYDHELDYSRLRGELEYSEIDQRWKLRYISIDEEKSDDYGGSVILSETAHLSGFERGEFIEVHGRILSGPKDDYGYARTYEVTDIQRVQ